MKLIRKQYDKRAKAMGALAAKGSTSVEKAEHNSDHFISSWEDVSTRLHKKDEFFMHNLTCLDRDWEAEIGQKFNSFKLDGEDSEGGKLGVNFFVDMANMRREIKDWRFKQNIESILKAKWFIIILVKLREKLDTLFTPIPPSCFKLLLAMKRVLMLGHEITVPVFYTLVSALILSEDHKDVMVHRTLKSICDVLRIRPDEFLHYLEEKDIQPCPELLSQVRQYRKQAVMTAKRFGLVAGGKNTLLNTNSRRGKFESPTASLPSSRPESAAEETQTQTVRFDQNSVEWRQKNVLLAMRLDEDKRDANSAMFDTFVGESGVFGRSSTVDSHAGPFQSSLSNISETTESADKPFLKSNDILDDDFQDDDDDED
jgi:hypothetical protein